MTDPYRPQSLSELRDAVAASLDGGASLDVSGLGSKRALGRPIQAARGLELSLLSGVRSYEPAELVLTAAAGTPLAEIEALLASKNQMLAFEPPHLGQLLGSATSGTAASGTPGSGTLGGAIACNLAGPRRIKSGAARDHFLGVVAVSGRGEIFKAGGKVVKNVTGYDLCKLLAGSFGTLAVMEEVTLKVMPAPAKTRSVLLFGLAAAEAVALLADALNSPYEISGAAYLPRPVARRSAVDLVRRADASVTALRIEGTAISAEARTKAVCSRLSHLAPIEELHTANSVRLWAEIRDVAALLPGAETALWRASVTPSGGPIVAAVALDGDYLLDWGGGLVWLSMPAAGDGGATVIRSAVKAAGGHAMLVRGAPALRAAIPVFEPPEPGLARLNARVKEGFDPLRVLNPGRMYADI